MALQIHFDDPGLVGWIAVQVTAVLMKPEFVNESNIWMWDILQRSNFVKNLCLLGVCFHLLHHKTGCLSLDAWFRGDFPRCRRD